MTNQLACKKGVIHCHGNGKLLLGNLSILSEKASTKMSVSVLGGIINEEVCVKTDWMHFKLAGWVSPPPPPRRWAWKPFHAHLLVDYPRLNAHLLMDYPLLKIYLLVHHPVLNAHLLVVIKSIFLQQHVFNLERESSNAKQCKSGVWIGIFELNFFHKICKFKYKKKMKGGHILCILLRHIFVITIHNDGTFFNVADKPGSLTWIDCRVRGLISH